LKNQKSKENKKNLFQEEKDFFYFYNSINNLDKLSTQNQVAHLEYNQ